MTTERCVPADLQTFRDLMARDIRACWVVTTAKDDIHRLQGGKQN
jgi:hypothetical protein